MQFVFSKNNKVPEETPIPKTLSKIKVPDSFPLKFNKKKYSLHHVGFPGTWQIDIMFGQNNGKQIAFLVAIEVNTRYLFMEKTTTYRVIGFDENGNEIRKIDKRTGTWKIEHKSTYAVAQAMSFCLDRGWNPSTLIGDAEKAFVSDEMYLNIYNPHNITFKPVFLFTDEKGNLHSSHTSLAIVDRVIRSCRRWFTDRGYEADAFTTELINEFVKYYNKRPHSTLCKIFKSKEITPQMVHDNLEMEMYVMQHILGENRKIRSSQWTRGMYIPNGTLVKLYNPPVPLLKRTRVTKIDPYRVVSSNNNIYTVHNDNVKDAPEEKVPRIWIDRL